MVSKQSSYNLAALREQTYTQSLHQHGVAQTNIGIVEHVLALRRLVRSLTSGLVVDANDHQPLVGHGVNKVLAANLDGMDGMRNGREERGDQRERANELSAVSYRLAMLWLNCACPQNMHVRNVPKALQRTTDSAKATGNRGTGLQSALAGAAALCLGNQAPYRVNSAGCTNLAAGNWTRLADCGSTSRGASSKSTATLWTLGWVQLVEK
jgi:hypothetical protein